MHFFCDTQRVLRSRQAHHKHAGAQRTGLTPSVLTHICGKTRLAFDAEPLLSIHCCVMVSAGDRPRHEHGPHRQRVRP